MSFILMCVCVWFVMYVALVCIDETCRLLGRLARLVWRSVR